MAQMKLFICPTCGNQGLWDWEWLTELYAEWGDPPPTFTMDGPCGTIIMVEDAIDVPDHWRFGDPIPDRPDEDQPPPPEPQPEVLDPADVHAEETVG